MPDPSFPGPERFSVSDREAFDIWHEVPLVPQLTGMSCWAAAAAMIVGWRACVDIDPEEVARGAGRWEAYRDGLEPEDVDALARAWDLHVEEPRSYDVGALRALLERHGPLWVGEASGGLHVVVVAGMYGDGTPDGTFVRVIDPWPEGRGERYTVSFRELSRNLEAVSDLAGVHAQILHAGGRDVGGSRSYRYEREVRASYGWDRAPRPTHDPRPRYGVPFAMFQKLRGAPPGSFPLEGAAAADPGPLPSSYRGAAMDNPMQSDGTPSAPRQRVVVKFRSDALVPQATDTVYAGRATATALEAADWGAFQARFPGIQISLLFGELAREDLQALAASVPGDRAPNFLSYVALDLPSGVSPNDVIDAAYQLDGVESAYLEAPPGEPPYPSGANPRLPGQHHLDPAPVGIDARAAWATPGGTGANIKFVDSEQGWKLDHEDLVGAGVTIISGTNSAFFYHGTRMLGIVLAQDNAVGGIGIVPDVSARVVSEWRPNGTYSRALAIVAAANVMSRGDVLLLESQSGPGPIEHEQAVFDAILAATSKGIHVVEPAGNFGTDLDAWTDPAGHFIFQRGHADFRDSGAIMVGCCTSAVPHRRLTTEPGRNSGFGSRVDCYAWGHNIDTTETDGTSTTMYTPNAGGTSGASAIVASVVCSLLSMIYERALLRPSPADVRAKLTNARNGTASGAPATDRIGIMPDLRKLVDNEVRTIIVSSPSNQVYAGAAGAAAFLDPGHGGRQDAGRSSAYGGRGPSGTLEKDVTLRIAERALAHFGGGARLSRDADYNLSLHDRLEAARTARAPVFVSIHANHGAPHLRGGEVWVYGRGGRGADASSLGLAHAIRNELQGIDAAPVSVRTGEVAVLAPAYHPAGVAACLVEADYLSHPAGEARLRDPRAVDSIGAAITRGVRRYLGARGLGRAVERAARGRSAHRWGDGDPTATMSINDYVHPFQALYDRARTDSDFRQRVAADPIAALTGAGINVDPDFRASIGAFIKGALTQAPDGGFTDLASVGNDQLVAALPAGQGGAPMSAAASYRPRAAALDVPYVQCYTRPWGIVCKLSHQAATDAANGANLAAAISAGVAVVLGASGAGSPGAVVAGVLSAYLWAEAALIGLADRGNGVYLTYPWSNFLPGMPPVVIPTPVSS
jgi:N-acetylmuramoyl-L-alanine amidase